MRRPWSGLGRPSLRRRILSVTAVAVVVALVLALSVYAYTLDRILLETSTRAAAEQAGQVTALLEDVPPTVAVARVPGQGSLIQLLGGDGRVIADNDPSAADVALADLRPRVGATESTQVIGVPLDESDPYAVVAVGVDPASHGGAGTVLVASPLKTETALVRSATLVLGCLALFLAVALLWLIDGVLARALGDVERIRSSVAEISTRDRSARVPEPPGDDEFARLARTMNGMLERLERADASQRAFVSDASHELRSPLTSVRAIAETSPNGIDAAGTAVVAGEALRMQRLVDDLLTLAKADDHGLSLRPEDVDIDDLLVAEVHRIRATTSLTAIGEISAARVVGDPLRLSQVVHNLVDNATRHARTSVRLSVVQEPGVDRGAGVGRESGAEAHGGVGARLRGHERSEARSGRLGVDADGGVGAAGGLDAGGARVVLHVDNDGEPIDPRERELVFERFSRLHAARDRDSGGSGLGLAIVKAVVEAHGGEVSTGEAPDGWCRFTVVLPAPGEQGQDEAPTVAGSSR